MDQAQSAPRPSGEDVGNGQDKPVSHSFSASTREKGQEELSADALFAPRGSDRSPQAWMARLLGAKSAARDFPSSGERPPVVKSLTDDVREQEAGNRQLISKAANIVNDNMQARADPVPLSQRARRFLKPLVGIDLENVPVYRDATAGRLTDAYQADAITLGERVEVAEGHLDDTPETLGLLAHEFTHVAQRRAP